MSYSAKADILEQLPENTLIQLTDDNNLGVVDNTVITRAIADADADIDAYCQARYTLPLSPVPDKIRRISVDLAIYHLYSRRDSFEPPEVRKERHKEAIRFLEKVTAGQIQLGATQPASTNTGNTVDISGNDRLFSRDNLDGF